MAQDNNNNTKSFKTRLKEGLFTLSLVCGAMAPVSDAYAQDTNKKQTIFSYADEDTYYKDITGRLEKGDIIPPKGSLDKVIEYAIQKGKEPEQAPTNIINIAMRVGIAEGYTAEQVSAVSKFIAQNGLILSPEDYKNISEEKIAKLSEFFKQQGIELPPHDEKGNITKDKKETKDTAVNQTIEKASNFLNDKGFEIVNAFKNIGSTK